MLYNYLSMVKNINSNMKEKTKISSDSTETRVALLEQSIGFINQTLIRIEKRLDRVDERIDKLESKMDKHFYWTLSMFGAMFGIMSHGFHWI